MPLEIMSHELLQKLCIFEETQPASFFDLWDIEFFRFDKAKDRNSFKNSQFRGGGCMYVNFIATNHCC